jgi:hypothetical protein
MVEPPRGHHLLQQLDAVGLLRGGEWLRLGCVYLCPGALNGVGQPLNVMPGCARDEVAVQVDGHTDRRVTELVRHVSNRHTSTQHQRSVRVAGIMRPSHGWSRYERSGAAANIAPAATTVGLPDSANAPAGTPPGAGPACATR